MAGKNNREKKGSGDLSWFLPLVLTIVLAILIVSLLLVRELKKDPGAVPITEPVPSLIPEAAIEEYPYEGKPRIAIIIDDMGWNKAIAGEIEKINQPLTLAFLPKAQFSREIFDSVKDNSLFELILHLPLEPNPPAQSFDKGLITTGMTEEEIKEQFKKNIEPYVPYVAGVNNHMGSRFTADKEKMGILLREINKSGLFFVDSVTSSRTVGYNLAKDMGIKAGKRDVFLDNKSDHEYIEKRIWELVESAKENGSAIGIGHAKKNTVRVLNEIMDALTHEVDIVHVSVLLE